MGTVADATAAPASEAASASTDAIALRVISTPFREGDGGAVQAPVRLETRVDRDDVRHQLDVVDHHPQGPEQLVALREEAAAHAQEQGAERRGQREVQPELDALEVL